MNSFSYDLNVFIVQDNKQEIQIMRRRIARFHLVSFFASERPPPIHTIRYLILNEWWSMHAIYER